MAEEDNLLRCEDDLGQYIYNRIILRQDIRIFDIILVFDVS